MVAGRDSRIQGYGPVSPAVLWVHLQRKGEVLGEEEITDKSIVFFNLGGFPEIYMLSGIPSPFVSPYELYHHQHCLDTAFRPLQEVMARISS